MLGTKKSNEQQLSKGIKNRYFERDRGTKKLKPNI